MKRPIADLPENRQKMVLTARRALNWFAANFGDHSFAAVSKGDVVFLVAKGDKGLKLRQLAQDWNGRVDDIEVWG